MKLSLKRFTIFSVCVSLSMPAIAVVHDPATPIGMTRVSYNKAAFLYNIPPGETLELGQMYFFTADSGLVFTGVYQGNDPSGFQIFSDRRVFQPSADGKGIGFSQAPSLSDTPIGINPNGITPGDEPKPGQAMRGNDSNPGDDIGTGRAAGDGPGIDPVGSGDAILGRAFEAGIATALVSGLVDSDENRGELQDIRNREAGDRFAISQSLQQMSELYSSEIEKFTGALRAAGNSEAKITDVLNRFPSNLIYESKDAEFVQKLRLTETVLNKTLATTPAQAQAKIQGYRMISEADRQMARNNRLAAEAFAHFASALADIAVGFDPVTGPIRDVYEAFTGKNLITQIDLNSFERTMAVVGVLTFGFTNDIAGGVKVLKAIKCSDAFSHATEMANRIFEGFRKEERIADNSAHSAMEFQRYKDQLRSEAKPVFQDPEMKSFMDDFWRDKAKVGNGSTTAAIRYEGLTGEIIGDGIGHYKKGVESVTFFKKWLKNNRHASSYDRANVEFLLNDLINTLQEFKK